MIQKRSHTLFVLCCLFMSWTSVVWAEETPALKKGVLVLPLQAGEGLTGEEVWLGVAVLNVIENMLTLHSDLDECWMNWHQTKLFPKEEDFRSWVQGTGDTSAAVQQLGFRYLLTGRVHHRNERLVSEVELLDRVTGTKQTSELDIDLPALRAFREGVLMLLEQTGIPVPAGQREKMLWVEELPLPAFALLGHGVSEYYATSAYHREQPQWNAKPYEEGLVQSPHSYLLLNNLGWVFHAQSSYQEARIRFEQALAINPMGADAADGLRAVGAETDDMAQEEIGARTKAKIQGRELVTALAELWAERGSAALRKGDTPQALAAFQKATALAPQNLGYKRALAALYVRLGQFAEGQTVLETAISQVETVDQSGLRSDLADIHVVWAKERVRKYAYGGSDYAL
jgi:tetratricopeptide (TPR) repeat protein